MKLHKLAYIFLIVLTINSMASEPSQFDPDNTGSIHALQQQHANQRANDSTCKRLTKAGLTLGLTYSLGLMLSRLQSPHHNFNYPNTPVWNNIPNTTSYWSEYPNLKQAFLNESCFACETIASFKNGAHHNIRSEQFCPTSKLNSEVAQEQAAIYPHKHDKDFVKVSVLVMSAPKTDPACADNPCTPYTSPAITFSQEQALIDRRIRREKKLKDFAQRSEQQLKQKNSIPGKLRRRLR